MTSRRGVKILVTGGCGFIGSEFVRQGVAAGHALAVVDALTYAGDRQRLASVRGRVRLYEADVRDARRLKTILQKEQPDGVVHFAAETHVDRSIQAAHPFISTNVEGTLTVMDACRQQGVGRLVHISTDEVYGDIARGRFKETAPLAPNSPYAASKAAADLLVKAYIRTYGLPAVIVRPSNNYGPWQYPEKLVPVVILRALNGQYVPVYAKGNNIREWLHVSDCARAVWTVYHKGRTGSVYNVGSGHERRNIDTVRRLLALMGKSPALIRFVKDRPGHDVRYALDVSRMRALGWRPRVGFEEGMRDVVAWCLDNRMWLERHLAELARYWKTVYRKA
ncbi:MAG: dTDP-glucose 4,6-dehydratase [Deltaproteobacteria bacterium]